MRNTQHIIIALLLLFVSIEGEAQIYFSTRYDFFTGPETAGSVLEVNDGYLVVGNLLDSSGSNLQLGLLKIDSLGNEVWKKSYGQSGVNYFPGIGSLISTLDGGFALGGGVNDQSISFAQLWRFDQNGDTLWTKRFGDGINFFTASQCIQTPDSGFVIIGATDVTDPDVDILLIKTNSLGVLEWQQVYGGGQSEYGFTVDVTDDKGYILGGNTESFGAGDKDTYIIKVDSTGNEQWSKTYGDIYLDCAAHIICTSDSGYVISTCTGKYILSGSFLQRRARVIKIDNGGNVVWDNEFGPARLGLGLFAIHELSDGSFITAGQTNNVMGTPVGNGFEIGVLLKTSSTGDSIWYREYEYDPCANNSDFIRDIKPTSDGGFITGGFFSPNTSFQCNDIGSQDMWVLKLDSCGCAYAGCDSACQQLVGIEETPYQASLTLKIYPNPASSMATVSIPNNGEGTRPSYANASVGENYHLSIYDITGREVESYEVNHQPTLTINTQELGTGLYFLQLKQEGRMLGSGKLVVE